MTKILRTRKPMERGLMLSPLLMAGLFVLIAVAGGRVYAATGSSGCAANDSSLYCRLKGVLDILYIAAAVLGVVLIVLAVFAYVVYRRNRARNLQETDRR